MTPEYSKTPNSDSAEIDIFDIDPPYIEFVSKEQAIEHARKYGCGDGNVPLAMGRNLTKQEFEDYKDWVERNYKTHAEKNFRVP